MYPYNLSFHRFFIGQRSGELGRYSKGTISGLSIYISIMARVSANGLGYRASISARIVPKTQKMVLEASVLSIHHYKVRIKG